MPLTFPSSPTVGQTYNVGTRTWTWDGSIWSMQAATLGVASISTSELVNGAVTTAKIADDSVTTAKIAADSITTAKIAAGAVVEADIASNAVTAGKLGTDVQLGYRNVVINGAMQIAQRGTSATGITGLGYFTADRWRTSVTTMGTWTQTQENDAPTGSGLRKSFKILCTTADASPAAGDRITVAQLFEGQNVQQFAKGTASAKQFTLSFWVKSNVTGTYIVELFDNTSSPSRIISASYTISASATWEKKTITFPADTTGAFSNDNVTALFLNFFLGAGSDFTSGTLNTTSWATTTSANRGVGQTNLAAATNNYWQITGVQLEAGSVATPFEFEDYSTTLAKCQRYYWRQQDNAANQGLGVGVSRAANDTRIHIEYPVTMRAAATSTSFSNLGIYDGTNVQAVTSTSINNTGPKGGLFQAVVASGLTTNTVAILIGNNASNFFDVSAEL